MKLLRLGGLGDLRGHAGNGYMASKKDMYEAFKAGYACGRIDEQNLGNSDFLTLMPPEELEDQIYGFGPAASEGWDKWVKQVRAADKKAIRSRR